MLPAPYLILWGAVFGWAVTRPNVLIKDAKLCGAGWAVVLHVV